MVQALRDHLLLVRLLLILVRLVAALARVGVVLLLLFLLAAILLLGRVRSLLPFLSLGGVVAVDGGNPAFEFLLAFVQQQALECQLLRLAVSLYLEFWRGCRRLDTQIRVQLAKCGLRQSFLEHELDDVREHAGRVDPHVDNLLRQLFEVVRRELVEDTAHRAFLFLVLLHIRIDRVLVLRLVQLGNLDVHHARGHVHRREALLSPLVVVDARALASAVRAAHRTAEARRHATPAHARGHAGHVAHQPARTVSHATCVESAAASWHRTTLPSTVGTGWAAAATCATHAHASTTAAHATAHRAS
mmetsp:Transcript_14773/g.37022  ORF Transcript_14773/g.37022 Transcript_14773/m.37022 type:complete len:303 (-) Transcript_14773:1683-2591(-)